MTVYAITDTKKGEQGLRLLIFKLPHQMSRVGVVHQRSYRLSVHQQHFHSRSTLINHLGNILLYR